MAGLCLLLAGTTSLPAPEAFAGQGASTMVLEEEGPGLWTRLRVQQQEQSISFSRLGPEDERFSPQLQGLSALVLQARSGEDSPLTPLHYGLLARIARSRHLIGVATEPALQPGSEGEAKDMRWRGWWWG